MGEKLLATVYDLNVSCDHIPSDVFHYYLELMGLDEDGEHKDSYYEGFQNGTFWLKSYHWGECTCGSEPEYQEFTSPERHDAECLIYKPNFIYTKKNFMMEWYKHPGRSMRCNKPITLKEFHDMMEDCLQSMEWNNG